MPYVQGHEVKKRRLEGLVCNILLGFVIVALCLGILAFLATRSHMYHVSLTRRMQELDNNMTTCGCMPCATRSIWTEEDR